jgi:CubicO group peptidase (beta-lactamase class C family)
MIDVKRLTADLEPICRRAMAKGNIPSATVALVADDVVIWTRAEGRSNIRAQTRADIDTVYLIGSIFKPMSAIALLQLMEKKSVGLDDPVYRYLDFKIGGDITENPVTFRHLLTHTSGVNGDLGVVPVWSNTAPLPLEDFVRTSLSVKSLPLSKVEYSDTGFALIGYLIQRLSGVEFKQYMHQHVFEPLEMSSMVFEPTPEIEERLSMPYVVDPTSGRQVPEQRVKLAAYPAGVVYGTVLDLANFLIVTLNNGTFKGKRAISETLIDQMFTCQYDQFRGGIEGMWGNETAGFGLAWWVQQRDGENYFAHSGSLPGYTAFLLGNRDQKIGFAVMTNGNEAHQHLFELGDHAIDLMKKYSVAN